MKLHPSYITDLGTIIPLDNCWIKSDVPMFLDTACTLPIANPASMEVITLSDIRFNANPTLTIIDKNGDEVYVSQPILVDDSFGSNAPAPIDTSNTTGYFKRLRVNSTNEDAIDIRTAGSIAADGTIYAQTFTTGGQNVTATAITNWNNHLTNTSNPHSTTFAQLLSKPTTLAGYGVASTDTLFDTKYVNQAVQYTNPTWLAGIDATTIKTGTIDLARLPAMPSANTIVCTTIPAMSAGDQLLVAKGTVVIESTTGNTYRYSGTGSVVLNASYIQQSDMTPDWAVITNKPTNVSTWTNDAGYLTAASSLAWAKLTGVPATFAPSAHTHLWANITDKPSTFTPSAHTHTQSEITGLEARLAGIDGNWANYATNTALANGLATKADTSHVHTFASLTSKPTTLSGYGITDAASSTHTHTFAALTSKPTTLSGYGITDAVGSSDARLTDARTPNNNAALVQGSTANTGAQGKRTTNLGSTANAINGVLDSGFYDSAATTNPNGSWMHFINSSHNNNYAGNQYQFQIGASFSNDKNQSWGPEGYWVRTICGNAQVGVWRKLWHDGNFDANRVTNLETRMTAVDNNWANYATASHTHTFASLTSKPTTLAGYGITDAVSTTSLSGYVAKAGDTLIDNAYIISYGSGAGGLTTQMKNPYYPDDLASNAISSGIVWWGRAGVAFASAKYTGNDTTGDLEFANVNGGFKFNQLVTFAGGTSFTGTVNFGNAFVGTHAIHTGWAEFTHNSNKGSSTGYNVLCNSDGTLNLNTPSGKAINFSVNNGASKMVINNDGVNLYSLLRGTSRGTDGGCSVFAPGTGTLYGVNNGTNTALINRYTYSAFMGFSTSNSEFYGMTNDHGYGTGAQLSLIAGHATGTIGFYAGTPTIQANNYYQAPKVGTWANAGLSITGYLNASAYVVGANAAMSAWAINGGYAWFGLNGTNGSTWATANGMGTNGSETWICSSGNIRMSSTNNTDALWITGTELYSKNSIYSFGSFVGSVVAPSDSLGGASRLGVLSSNKQNGWCISYGASGDMQLWDSTANNWTLRYRFAQLAMKMPIYAVAGSSGTTIAQPLYDGEIRLYRGATLQGPCYLKCRSTTEIIRYRTDAGVKVDLNTPATNVPVDIQGTVVMLIWAMNGVNDGRWTMLS